MASFIANLESQLIGKNVEVGYWNPSTEQGTSFAALVVAVEGSGDTLRVRKPSGEETQVYRSTTHLIVERA